MHFLHHLIFSTTVLFCSVLVAPRATFAIPWKLVVEESSASLNFSTQEEAHINRAIEVAKNRIEPFLYFFSNISAQLMSIIFLNENEFHERYSAPKWSIALYRENQILVKYPSKSSISSEELQITLIHELIHAIIANEVGSSCPHWLDEGIAMIFEKLSTNSLPEIVQEILSHPLIASSDNKRNPLAMHLLFRSRGNLDPQHVYRNVTQASLALLVRGFHGHIDSQRTLEACLPNIAQFSDSDLLSHVRKKGPASRMTQGPPPLLPAINQNVTSDSMLAVAEDDKQFSVLTLQPLQQKLLKSISTPSVSPVLPPLW